MTPIKTGAWLWRDEYNDGVWCDLYVIGDCLVARVTEEARNMNVYKKDELDEGLWATMHTCPGQFGGDGTQTWISNDFTLHYELQFSNGNWHSVRIDVPEIDEVTEAVAELVFSTTRVTQH